KIDNPFRIVLPLESVIFAVSNPLSTINISFDDNGPLTFKLPPFVVIVKNVELELLMFPFIRYIGKDSILPNSLSTAWLPVESIVNCSSVIARSEEYTSELQSRGQLVCRLLLA